MMVLMRQIREEQSSRERTVQCQSATGVLPVGAVTNLHPSGRRCLPQSERHNSDGTDDSSSAVQQTPIRRSVFEAVINKGRLARYPTVSVQAARALSLPGKVPASVRQAAHFVSVNRIR